MTLFETMLALSAVAVVLLQFARRFAIPYPTMLALAGVLVAVIPGAPIVVIEPRLALALFIAPALMEAAYDLPARELRRHWVPLFALAGVAVLLTTGAVAWLAVSLTGMPWYAGLALGAIVAPPDAAAASAVLSRFSLPRRSVSILKGESLLNDAVALLVFVAAVEFGNNTQELTSLIPALSLAVPGGVLTGFIVGKLFLAYSPRLAGTLGGSLFEIVTTFGAWVIAERLGVSAILSVVTFAMVVARDMPGRQSPRDRVHSYAIWETFVFMLNVLAFLLMGLQAQWIITQLDRDELWFAVGVAAAVLATVITVRLVWVMFYNRAANRVLASCPTAAAPSLAQGVLVSWSGMRGLVTLATALALPSSFPFRDVILLCAFAVVLGTLILQGLTLGPLIQRLQLKPDPSFDIELAAARSDLISVALAELDSSPAVEAEPLRLEYLEESRRALHPPGAPSLSSSRTLRLACVNAQRQRLLALRQGGQVEEDVFHALERELDWVELAFSNPEAARLIEA